METYQGRSVYRRSEQRGASKVVPFEVCRLKTAQPPRRLQKHMVTRKLNKEVMIGV
jgi:hypothetical protein